MRKRKGASALTIDIAKYGGLQVAIVNGRIIASGRTASEVLERVRRIDRSIDVRDIELFAVPKTLATIYAFRRIH